MTHLKSILAPLGAGISAPLAVAAPPSGLVTCSNLTLEVNGASVGVEHLTKACPPDAPDWFRYNASNKMRAPEAALHLHCSWRRGYSKRSDGRSRFSTRWNCRKGRRSVILTRIARARA